MCNPNGKFKYAKTFDTFDVEDIERSWKGSQSLMKDMTDDISSILDTEALELSKIE